MQKYFVYIMASKKDGVLYVGITNDLLRRVYEHKQGTIDGFTKKYFTKKLVYFETTSDVKSAIAREKCLKRWKREWKIRLIKESNPEWKDLYNDLIE
jgi:putative endonuclease